MENRRPTLPGAGGGANFPGASMDLKLNLYMPSVTRPTGMSLVEPPEGTSRLCDSI